MPPITFPLRLGDKGSENCQPTKRLTVSVASRMVSTRPARTEEVRNCGSSGKGMLMFTVNNLGSLSSPKAPKIR